MNSLLFTLLIGIGATGVMDAWGVLRKLLFGIPTPNYGMVGRWIAHMSHGQFRHNAIAASAQVSGEEVIGWIAHYLTGISFAAILIAVWGNGWIQNPTIVPALLVGIATVAAPFLIMQPGMGAGVAASKTKNPNAARLQSLITHTVFGVGLYASGKAVQLFCSM
ncbi:DUF2938 domain-containing protein [Cellvibrio polysaccharolyticus]|uniref:DUF2938 domain-containing protein n=1 Tax=Cellvibrio polysaccharolyticus TaxID=2082724 RepID=A0A928V4M1_9GAMM|nr:DUF2938 domain-containing protein [Cellvibrio polysaccharolyticus]MBE8718177.1 DUF2938 domain-containing protein [Cellvibrio polysaccharolyticus]